MTMTDDLAEFMENSMYVYVPIDVHRTEIAYLKQFLINTHPEAAPVWRNMLAEIERITGHDELGNPLQSIFRCECGTLLISKLMHHNEDIFCDVCGKHYMIAYFDGVAHHVRVDTKEDML